VILAAIFGFPASGVCAIKPLFAMPIPPQAWGAPG
jgi:hypothetical protein